MRTKWGVSLDHWTSASHPLKPPANTVQAEGLYERLGVKLDIYWIHKQLKKSLSSVIYSTASFCWEHFYSFLAAHGWAQHQYIGLPLTLQTFSPDLFWYTVSFPRASQGEANTLSKGTHTLGSVEGCCNTTACFFRQPHLSWIVVLPPSRYLLKSTRIPSCWENRTQLHPG